MPTVPIANIRLDGGTQPRTTLYLPAVSAYREGIQAGDSFPPVIVFHDGRDHWLADGFHRLTAFLEEGFTEIEADVRQGTVRDAILFSVGANAKHGLPRTPADKRMAVLRLLRDEEWGQWSHRKIAEVCSVSKTFVNQVHEELREELRRQNPGHSLAGIASEERKYRDRWGNESTMKVGNIGKMPGPKLERDRVATRPSPAPSFSGTLEPEDEPEYDERGRHTDTGRVIEPRPPSVTAMGAAYHRLWQAMTMLPEKPDDLVAGIPTGADPQELYRWADFLSDVAELVEQRESAA